eukprot:CAMPEP_0206251754 /NCGR_PEP_ID=MMETSP0047_2-20121206/22198_1 /ASSEMBLY_ACC=CAM_ASM_000192 /TAXON_ID=195065 /ORGANISM="Chroomonas mesostigmatica_cf, Strain CCMP1168" /LENGTH=50 /DNA_ID=CAMNT_0053677739 /DNA_START=180 /DNA_END=329 /DNA_ORIENTATION=+
MESKGPGDRLLLLLEAALAGVDGRVDARGHIELGCLRNLLAEHLLHAVEV